MQFREQNRDAWDHLAESGSQFANVASDTECAHPLLSLDTRGWLPGSVKGLDVLCLAGGGGWQSILYASAGANVTVADISPAMLRLDEREAARRNLRVRTLETSMDDLVGARGRLVRHRPSAGEHVLRRTAGAGVSRDRPRPASGRAVHQPA